MLVEGDAQTVSIGSCQRHHQPSSLHQLIAPRGRNLGRPGGDDDAFIRTVIGKTGMAVPDDDPDVSSIAQAFGGGGTKLLVDLHGDDGSDGTHQRSEKSRVVAAGRTDLEDAVAGPHDQLLQHQRHHRWL